MEQNLLERTSKIETFFHKRGKLGFAKTQGGLCWQLL
jgi:hypothetical protein